MTASAPESSSESVLRRDPRIWFFTFGLLTILGLTVVTVYGGWVSTSAAMGLIVLAGACFAVGGLLGFLFGVPRSLQRADEAKAGDDASGASASAATHRSSASRRYGGNTNLEQISDWLTKILVGAGLTQIGAAADHLRSIALFWAPLFGPTSSHPDPVVAASVVYFAVCGFLVTYLWARLHLGHAFTEADELVEIGRRIDRFEQQVRNDQRALSLVYRMLNPEKDAAPAKASDLRAALSLASEPVREQARAQARAARRAAWQHNDREGQSLTVPIFDALIESGDRGRIHQTHAQLAYALKDAANPDYRAAEAHLDQAIRIRGADGQRYWPLYEFNRAVCRIMQDPAFTSDPRTRSTEERKSMILADLMIMRRYGPPKPLAESPVAEWLEINRVDPATL